MGDLPHPVVATRFGVRVRTPAEFRQIAKIVGVIFIVYGASNLTFLLGAHDDLAHPDLFWIPGAYGDALGVFFLVISFAASDELFERFYVPVLWFGFLTSGVMTSYSMYLAGYPNSGPVSLAYGIQMTLAFYLLATWLAVAQLVVIVGSWTILALNSDTGFPLWPMLLFMAGALLVTGYLSGRLMNELDQARKSEHEANTELDSLNHGLEDQVAGQVTELERLSRLRRFLSAPVADAVLTTSDESVLAPHRREIAVLFCDLRGFTAFTKQVEPEEVMEVLAEYYEAAGREITKFEATLGAFEGDGLFAYLNDPNPCDLPGIRVVEMGLAIAASIDDLTPRWQRRGYDLSYGIGMALGHATLGIVGYDGRSDYTALGTVVNLGARLCTVATARQLIVDHRIALQAEDSFTLTELEPRALKGFAAPVRNYLVARGPGG